MAERHARLAAAAALCLATAAQFARVFDGTRWALGALGIVAVLTLVTVVVERNGPRVAAYVGFGVVVIVMATRPHERLVVVPTPQAVASTVRALFEAQRAIATTSVPTSATGTPWLLAVVTIWVAGACTLHAVRRGATRFAVVAPCAIAAFAVELAGRHGAVLVTVAWLLALAILVAVDDHHDDRAVPAARVSRRHRNGAATAGTVIGALLVAAVVGAALATPTGLLDYRRLGRSGSHRRIVAVSPMSSLRARLLDPSDAELFRVRSDRPARWRLVALDKYRDGAWVLDDPTVTDALRPVRFPDGVPVVSVHQEYSIGPMGGAFLPAADRPQALERTDGHRRFDGMVVVADSGTVVVTDEDHDTTRYRVTSQFVAPSTAALHRARLSEAERATLTRDLALPAVDPGVVALARIAVSGAADPYAQAQALEAYLTDPTRFRYDTSVDLGETPDALARFLVLERRGFCQQFASAFAVMARIVGLPTRVAVGFLPGRTENGTHVVRSRDAHAWPEVFFGGIGWVPFEPTPSPRVATPPPGASDSTPTSVPTDRPSPTTVASDTTTTAPAPAPSPSSVGRTRAPLDDEGNALVSAVKTLVLLVLASAIALGWRGASRYRRRSRGSPAARIERAWDTVMARFALLGVHADASNTPLEFARTIGAARGTGSAAPLCVELAMIHGTAAYGPGVPTEPDAAAAWDLVERIETTLRVDARGRRRLVRLRLWW